ncbi:urease accessory protein UreD [Defluviimonas sp. SAOS-178_SWC]|uniref:urease accessory protein UreD n=1 Tax=Defluviimonas sp. SAOS-178_SWC TaxID=3121287 RepID=UPI0032216316
MIQTNIYPDPDWIVGKQALMNVRAHVVNGRTIVQPSTWRIPFQWQGYHYQDHDDQPFMLMVNSGGGFVEGDGSYFYGSVEEGARALFTTTASGKFYKCLNGMTSTEVVEFNVAPDATLEYLPDEAIPYEASRSKRRILVNLHESSRMFASDMVSAGRVHYGREIFKFHALESSFEIQLEGETLAVDRMRLDGPEEVSDLERLWGGARHAALIFAYAPDLPDEAQELVRLHCADVDDTQVGVSRIGNLLSVRILATETWQAHETIFKAWMALRPAIAGKAARPILKC